MTPAPGEGGATAMRVALVHSFYRSAEPSGENAVVLALAAALSRAGHEVRIISAVSDDLTARPLYRLRTAARVASGRGRSPLAALRRFAPDVVHVHNLFPNYGRRWLRSVDAPVVLTLHNFRPLCAAGSLFRDGHVCTLCPDGRRLSGIRYRCYRGSLPATVPLALANLGGPARDPALAAADRILVPSRRVAHLYARYGIDANRIHVVPHFVPEDLDPGPGPDGHRDGPWLFVGRFAPEKGIVALLERWPGDRPLVVVGDGPEAGSVRAAAAGKAVEVTGLLPREEVVRRLRGARGLVLPSRWYETFALVHAEALAAGTPVLAWEPNIVADAVSEDGTGLATSWEEDLAAALDRAEAAFPAMRARCRDVFVRRYSEAAVVSRLEDCYRSVMRVDGPAVPKGGGIHGGSTAPGAA